MVPACDRYSVELFLLLLLLFVSFALFVTIFLILSYTKPCHFFIIILILVLLILHFSSACSIILSPADSYGGGRQPWGVLGHH